MLELIKLTHPVNSVDETVILKIKENMVLDKTIGAIIIVMSIIWHLYYTIWILVTPWLETSQDLAHWLKYFPDRYYGLAIPALLLAFIITSAATFIGVILQSAGIHQPSHHLRSSSSNHNNNNNNASRVSSKHSSTPSSVNKTTSKKTLHFSPRRSTSSTNNNNQQFYYCIVVV